MAGINVMDVSPNVDIKASDEYLQKIGKGLDELDPGLRLLVQCLDGGGKQARSASAVLNVHFNLGNIHEAMETETPIDNTALDADLAHLDEGIDARAAQISSDRKLPADIAVEAALNELGEDVAPHDPNTTDDDDARALAEAMARNAREYRRKLRVQSEIGDRYNEAGGGKSIKKAIQFFKEGTPAKV